VELVDEALRTGALQVELLLNSLDSAAVHQRKEQDLAGAVLILT